MDENPNPKRGAPPEVVAKHLFRVLKQGEPQITNFDMLCFAAQITASQALENSVFRGVAVELNKLVYAIYENLPTESCVKLAEYQMGISTSTGSSTTDTTKSP